MKVPIYGTLLALVPLAISMSPRLAHADSTNVCLSAPVDGQKLQRSGKLLAARDKYAACSNPSCPFEIVHDCLDWLRQVDDALPSVVLAARDASGADIDDVQVSIDDGAPAPTSTRATRLDPGAHTFVVRHGGVEKTQQLVLREGEKNREVLIVFGAIPHAMARPVSVATWATGGVAVAAIGTFGVFGALGLAERSSNHCDTGCPADAKSGVDSKFLVADVALGVGIVAVAAATLLYLMRPTVEEPQPAVTLDATSLRLRF